MVTKGFVIVFESGIIVIMHWKRNNYIQKDRYKEIIYKDEKSYQGICKAVERPIKTIMQPCFTGMRTMRKNCERKQMIEAKLQRLRNI